MVLHISVIRSTLLLSNILLYDYNLVVCHSLVEGHWVISKVLVIMNIADMNMVQVLLCPCFHFSQVTI